MPVLKGSQRRQQEDSGANYTGTIGAGHTMRHYPASYKLRNTRYRKVAHSGLTYIKVSIFQTILNHARIKLSNIYHLRIQSILHFIVTLFLTKNHPTTVHWVMNSVSKLISVSLCWKITKSQHQVATTTDPSANFCSQNLLIYFQ